MFVILKPEMRRCMNQLDPYLEDAGFEISSRHSVPNWEFIARQIYGQQFLDPTFASEFNVYLWMTQSFFGNSALAYQITREDNIKANIERLAHMKKRFRTDMAESLDAPINFLVNLEKIMVNQPVEIGARGQLGVNNSPFRGERFSGRWDYFFFKYIHTSDDPEKSSIEEQVLVDNGIYNQKIDNSQWEQMVATSTLIPFSQGGKL